MREQPNVMESPNSVESLLELQTAVAYEHGWKFQCREHLKSPEGEPTSWTSCVLERGHDGLHQGVQMFTTVRAIAWAGRVEVSQTHQEGDTK